MLHEMWNDFGMRTLIILYGLWWAVFLGSSFFHFTVIPWQNKKRIKEGKPLINGMLGTKRKF